MADTSLNDGGFWLPSEFLTDEDLLMDKENFNKTGLNSNYNLCFPTEFGSFGSTPFPRSPNESVTESESDDDDFLTGLAHKFARSTLQETHKILYALPRNHPEKTWGFSGSPQSTLSPVSGNGSPTRHSKGPSPTTTPPIGNDDAWDLICAAAGQMNGLKMKYEGDIKNRGLVAPTRSFTQIHPPNPTNGFYNTHLVKQQSNSIWGERQVYQNRASTVSVENGGFDGNGRCGKAPGMPESVWPPLQVQKQQQYYQNQKHSGGGGAGRSAAFRRGGSGGVGVKRECAGTGVFLPRRYTTAPDSRMKSGSSTALLPPRVKVVDKNFENMMTTRAEPRLSGGFIPDYDLLMARRNALLAQQRSNNMVRAEGAMNQEIRLPQEWTY